MYFAQAYVINTTGLKLTDKSFGSAWVINSMK